MFPLKILTNHFLNPHTKSVIWWKIYFWLTLLLTAFGIPSYYGGIHVWGIFDWILIFYCIASMVGLYAYAYTKKLFTPQYWQYFFYLAVFFVSWDILFAFTPLQFVTVPTWLKAPSMTVVSGQEILFSTLISLPLFYAIYMLAYPKKTSQKKSTPKPKKSKK